MNKIILVIIIILLIGAGGYFLSKMSPKPSLAPANLIPTFPSVGQENNTATVILRNLTLNPGVLKVPVGTTVVWKNEDTAPHRIQFEELYSNTLDPGQTFEHQFNQKGEFWYICEFHRYMRGRIIVE